MPARWSAVPRQSVPPQRMPRPERPRPEARRRVTRTTMTAARSVCSGWPDWHVLSAPVRSPGTTGVGPSRGDRSVKSRRPRSRSDSASWNDRSGRVASRWVEPHRYESVHSNQSVVVRGLCRRGSDRGVCPEPRQPGVMRGFVGIHRSSMAASLLSFSTTRCFARLNHRHRSDGAACPPEASAGVGVAELRSGPDCVIGESLS